MSADKKAILRSIGFIAFVVLGFIFLPFFSLLLIAGVIQNGILGGFSGKVGPVVGGNWKDIDYMRSYVIPANPQSAGQVTQRTRFTVIQDYARQVLSTLIHPYWDPYYSDKSGYNAIMSDWLLNASAGNLLDSNCLVSKGTLAKQSISDVVYDTTTLEFSWVMSLVGNQLATDVAHAVIFNKATGTLTFSDGDVAKTRANLTLLVTVGSGLTASDLECYLFFSQGSGSSMIVSDSDHQTAATT